MLLIRQVCGVNQSSNQIVMNYREVCNCLIKAIRQSVPLIMYGTAQALSKKGKLKQTSHQRQTWRCRNIFKLQDTMAKGLHILGGHKRNIVFPLSLVPSPRLM